MTDTNANKNNVNSNHVDTDINTINSRKSREDDQIVAHYTKEGAEPVERVKFEGFSDNDKLPPSPDGGWGWVIVLSSFIITTCTNGLAFSFGLLHEEITSYFQTTQSQTSLIGSLFIASPLLAGPIMSALVDRYGCRVTTMVAGVISATGFVLAALSSSVEMLCLTFGIISGLATGIFYVTPIVSVAFWFDKKRNFAFSLAFCGVGFGTFIYSPMTEYFLYKYDWRNTIVLLAGTLLNMCVCGALIKNPEWLEIKQKREGKLKARSRTLEGVMVSSKSKATEAEELNSLLKIAKSPEYILEKLATSKKEKEAMTQIKTDLMNIQRIHSTIHLPTFVQQNEKVPAVVTDKLITNKKLYNIILRSYPEVLAHRHSEVNINVDNKTEEAPEMKLPDEIKTQKSNKGNLKEKKDGTVFIELNEFTNKLNNDYFKAKRKTENKMKSISLPDMNRRFSWSQKEDPVGVTQLKWYHRLWNAIKTTFDFNMFTEFHFLMFNLSLLILSVWFIVPFFFLTSYMTDMDVEGGANVMSVIGISSIIGLVVLGWTGDQPWINVTKTYAICLIICGLCVASYPLFITNFWMLTIVSAIFGFAFASSYSCTPGILMSLIPLDRTIVAYGLMLLIQGVGHLVGPPIGGMLYDVTGSWDVTFYVAGAWVLVSGLCVAVIAYTDDIRICGTAPLLMEVERAKCKADV